MPFEVYPTTAENVIGVADACLQKASGIDVDLASVTCPAKSGPGSELVYGSIWASMGGQYEAQAIQCRADHWEAS
jgi:hypothetical protein